MGIWDIVIRYVLPIYFSLIAIKMFIVYKEAWVMSAMLSYFANPKEEKKFDLNDRSDERIRWHRSLVCSIFLMLLVLVLKLLWQEKLLFFRMMEDEEMYDVARAIYNAHVFGSKNK